MLSPRMRQFLDRLPACSPPSRARAPRGGERSADIVGKLLEATLHFRVATMRYHSVSSGRVKDYLVHPYRLAFAQGGLYLLALRARLQGHPHVRRRPHRVGLAREADVHAASSTIGDDVFANSLGVNTGPAGAGRDRVRRRGWRRTSAPGSGTRRSSCASAPTGGLVLSMDVCHDWALRSWILSWGPFARVAVAGGAGATRSEPICRRPLTRYARPIRRNDSLRHDRPASSSSPLVVVLFFWPARRSSASTPTGSGSARSATSRSSSTMLRGAGHAVHHRLRDRGACGWR